MPSPVEVDYINGDTEDEEPTKRMSSDKEPFSALAFKIANDPFIGTLTFTHIYSGELETHQGKEPAYWVYAIGCIFLRCMQTSVQRSSQPSIEQILCL